ncbi:uncharacterized protein BDR25DRAFT_21441 [Lindgomyces ingoldianus]|uniref:Uncharacterized protein n=1 Tax=Lindgomyces ingoldianus TaxID=673940 RepID=A0ACB6QZS6_9PLEO|nr:uncharacterized protein BDR25DRAFT_21441 [Lindgomyces ingoldianus]KAF2471592.1 hypothetical protein BDR25DRAFT_21441 [Lindgomyces ingoldianus]
MVMLPVVALSAWLLVGLIGMGRGVALVDRRCSWGYVLQPNCISIFIYSTIALLLLFALLSSGRCLH